MLNLILTFFISLSYSNSDLADLDGKTFAYAGPNCFGVALYARGINSIIRGVDVGEFKAVLKHQCQLVQTPQVGDIGTYSIANYDVIHAFYYYSKDLVLEKTGVDYLEKTPIYIRKHNYSYHTFGYSKECVHYGGKDNPVCYNQLSYYRCKNLKSPSPAQIIAIEERIEAIFEELFKKKSNQIKTYKQELSVLINDYARAIKQNESDYAEILTSRLKSYQLQSKFL